LGGSAWIWRRGSRSFNLPDDIESIYVGAVAHTSQISAVVVEYASPKLKVAEAEEDRRMSDLL